MLKNKRRYKYSIRDRMTLYFSLMLIVILVIFIVFYYSKSIANLNDEIALELDDRLESQDKFLDVFLESYDQLTLSLCSDEKLISILEDKSFDTEDAAYIQKKLNHYFLVQKNISYIQLFIPKTDAMVQLNCKTCRSFSQTNVKWQDFSAYEVYESCMQSGKHRTIFAEYSPEDDVTDNFYYVREISDIKSKKPLGILLIYFNSNLFESIYGDFLQATSGFSGIFTEENKPIMLNNNAYWQENNEYISDILNQEIKNEVCTSFSDDYNYIGVKEDSSMKYVVIQPKEEQQKAYVDVLYQSVGVFLFASIVMIVIIRYISRGITEPIVSLANHMKKIDITNHDVHIVREQDDEIGYLTKQFESMLEKIDVLIEEKYVSTINENNARLKALQAQINPHFLYNSLQVISTQAMLNNDKTIMDMVDALANTYRYSIKTGDVVTVVQEKNNLENYLKINKYRYEEQLNYSIFISEEVEEFIVPKFTFQVLAENAIKHGMNESELNLMIVAEKINDSIVFRLIDNGTGFDEEKRLKLMQRIRMGQTLCSESHGLGLQNLYDRFVNMYGFDHVEMNIINNEQQTTVEFEIIS